VASRTRAGQPAYAHDLLVATSFGDLLLEYYILKCTAVAVVLKKTEKTSRALKRKNRKLEACFHDATMLLSFIPI